MYGVIIRKRTSKTACTGRPCLQEKAVKIGWKRVD